MGITFDEYVKRDNDRKKTDKIARPTTFDDFIERQNIINSPEWKQAKADIVNVLPEPEQKQRVDSHDVLHGLYYAPVSASEKNAASKMATAFTPDSTMYLHPVTAELANQMQGTAHALTDVATGKSATDVYMDRRREQLKSEIDSVNSQIRGEKRNAATYRARTGGLTNPVAAADAQAKLTASIEKQNELNDQKRQLVDELHSIGGKTGLGDFLADFIENNVTQGSGFLADFDIVDYYLSRFLGLIDKDDQAAYDRAHALQQYQQEQQEKAMSGYGKLGQELVKASGAAGRMMGYAGASGIVANAAAPVIGNAGSGLMAHGTRLADNAGAASFLNRPELMQNVTWQAGNAVRDVLANPTNLMISASSALHTFDDAKSKGASNKQAFSAALMSGAAEYYSNKMFSGTPFEDNPQDVGYVTEIIEAAAKKLGKTSEESVGKFFNNKIISYIFDKSGEGWEEVITGVLDPLIARITYDPEADLATADELLEEWIGGVLMSGILGITEPVTNFQRRKAENRQENYTKIVNAIRAAAEAGQRGEDFATFARNNAQSLEGLTGNELQRISQVHGVGSTFSDANNAKVQNIVNVAAATMGERGARLAAAYRARANDVDAADYFNDASTVYEQGRTGAEMQKTWKILSNAEAQAWYDAGKADSVKENNNAKQSGNESEGRVNRLDSAEQSGAVAEGAVKADTGSQEGVRSAGAESVANASQRISEQKTAAQKLAADETLTSSAERGITNGTNYNTMREITNKHRDQWTEAMNEVARIAEEAGVKVRFYTGRMALDDGSGVFFARGLNENDGSVIWVRADADEDIIKIAKHELFHTAEKRDANLDEDVRQRIVKDHGTEALQTMVQKYADKYRGSGMSDEELLREIYADAYGGIDVFEGITEEKDATPEQKTRAPQFNPQVTEGVQASKPTGSAQQSAVTMASREQSENAEIPDSIDKTLEKHDATVRDGVVVADSIAKFMDSPEYHQPVSVSDLADMASHDTLPSWAEKYINGGGSKEALNAIQQFDDMIWKSMSGDFTDAQKLLQALVPSGHVDTDKFGPLRTNVEYRRSFDMDTSCPRTFQFVAYRNAIMKRLNRTLTLDESINLINLMSAYHQMIPCTYCYVENKRILKAAYYNNFYAFHNAVLNGVNDGLTVEDLRPKMYGWNAEKGKLTDAAEKTLTQVWMKDTSGYNPTIAQNYHTVNVIRNAAMHLLDDMMEAGKITSDTSVNSLTNIIATEYDIKSRGALAEVTKMAEDWRYDAGRNAEHMYLIEDNGERVNKKTADRALELDNEAIMYANSASSAKTVDNYAPYGGELENISQEDREYILGMGGIRKHSSNDFRIDYVLDYFQFFADLTKGKWTGHTYTKSADYVRIFGRTGDMINMSIAFNDTKDGVTENVSEGMEHKLARELRKAYANAGIMAMVTSDKQLSYALNTDWVDMIIPFHNSGLPKAIWYNMKAWTDYTSVQGESLYNSDDKKAALQSRGIDIKNMSTEEVNDAFYETFGIKKAINTETGKVFAPHFFPYETTQHGVKVPGHNNSKSRYMELCKEYGVHPRFDGTIVQDADGNDINVVDHPNYMKLIKETSRATENFQQPTIEFSFANADPYLTEKYGKQYGKKSVTPMDYAMARLYEEAKNGGYQNAEDDQFGIVDEFVKKYAGKNKPVGWLDERSKLVKNELDTVQDKLVDKTRKATLKELEKTEGKKKKSKVRSNFYMENSSGESDGVNRGNKNAYSLEDVPAVTPTGGWERGATFDEVKAKHPTLFELAADEAEVRNPTQITGTVKTYRKIYDILKAEGFKGKILDASSGLGVGTEAGRSEYGFDVDDIEPFPDAKYQPKYTDYSKLNKKYDAIISNAVLNVIPQDLRDAMVVKIGQLLAPGGRAYINVRGTDVKNASSKVAINEDGMEYFISDSGSYQKGFRKQELVSYLQDALGDGFTVEPTNQFGGVAAIVTKDGGQNMASRETDAAYMKAVESGDMDTAQRMVDDAANAAFPDSTVRDEDGKLLMVYHGGEKNYTVFDRTKGRSNMDIQGTFFTPWELDAQGYGSNVRKFFLNLTNPADESTGYRALNRYKGQNEAGIKAREYLEARGYDGVNNSGEEYIAFTSNQIKSADPVTYDDNGNVIPLSERFNPENEDIRYSRDVIGEAPDRNYNIPEGYGVFIRNTRAKYVDKIFSGEKTIETRPNRTLDSYLHKWAPIVDTAKRQVIGEAYIDSVIEYDDAKDFRADADRHLVPENSKYDWDGKGKRYGYVITETRKYDTPIPVPADAKKYGRIATAYSREDDTNRLMQENTDLRQRLDAALADTKQTTAWRANAKDVARVADDIIGATSSKESKAIVAQKIRSLVEAASNGGIDSAEMKDLALDIARGLLKRSSVLTTKDSTTYDGMRDYLKSVYINVPSEMRKEITDWKAFAAAHKAMRMKTTGVAINEVYKEMQKRMGKDYFPDIDSDIDKLRQIAEVLDTLTPVYDNPYSVNMAEATEETANSILESILNIGQAEPTYADRAKARENEVRELYQQKLADQKAYLQQRIQDEADKRKQQTEAIKQHYTEMQENRRLRKQDSEARQKLLRVAKRLQNRKLDAVNRAMVDQLIGDLDTVSVNLTNRSLTNLKELADWYDSYKDDPNFLTDPQVEKKLSRLEKRHIGEMTLDEVRDLTDVLRSIENALATYGKMVRIEDHRLISEMSEQSQENIRNTAGSKKNIADWLVTNTLAPERLIRRLTGYNDSDPLYMRVKELSEGQRKMMDYQMRAEALFSKWTNDKKLIERLRDKDTIKARAFVDGKETTVEITPDMRMALYLHSLNDQNLKHIMNGGIRIPDIELYRNGDTKEAYSRGVTAKMSPDMVRGIANGMSAEERSFANAAKAYFNGMSRDEINAVSEALLGYSLANVENYFPIQTDDAFTMKEIDAIQNDGSIQGMGFTKERQNASNAIYLVPMTDVLKRSIQNHAKYVGMAIPVANMNRLWMANTKDGETDTTSGLKDAMRSKWGDRANEAVEQILTDVQNPRRSKDGKWLASIRSNYAGAVLTLNASVAMKQAASYPTAAAVLGWEPLLKAMKNYGKVDLDLIAKYTPLQWYRSQGFSTQELGDIKSQSGLMDKVLSAHITTKDGREVPLLNWIQGIDLMTTRKLWKASEYYVQQNQKDLKPGTDDYYKAVADVYNRVIEETQPNYTTMQRPQLLRSDNQLLQSLVMFKTQPFQNFNILYDAIGELRAAETMAKNGDPSKLKQARQNAVNAVTSNLVSAVVFAAMTMAWALARRKREKYEDDEGNFSPWGQLGKDILSSELGMIPFGSDAYNLLASMFLGEKYYGMTNITSDSLSGMTESTLNAFNTLKETVTALLDGDDKTQANPEKIARKLFATAKDASKLLGIPMENVLNLMTAVYSNVASAVNGEYTTAYEVLRLEKGFTSSSSKSTAYDILYKAYQNDRSQYNELRRMMVDDGFKESSIDSAMKKRSSK